MGYVPPARPGEDDPMVGFSLFLVIVGFIIYPAIIVWWFVTAVSYTS